MPPLSPPTQVQRRRPRIAIIGTSDKAKGDGGDGRASPSLGGATPAETAVHVAGVINLQVLFLPSQLGFLSFLSLLSLPRISLSVVVVTIHTRSTQTANPSRFEAVWSRIAPLPFKNTVLSPLFTVGGSDTGH